MRPVEVLDIVTLHFDQQSLRLMNACLGLVMFGVALDLTVADFARLLKQPRKVVTGLVAQVLAHNAVAYALGYLLSAGVGLNLADRKAITLETGIQNSGLALILIFNFFDGLGGMALLAGWWGIWDMISGLALAVGLSRYLPPPERSDLIPFKRVE